jgi:hypothetical protein
MPYQEERPESSKSRGHSPPIRRSSIVGTLIDDGRVIVMGPSAVLATSPLARNAFLGDDFRVPPLIGNRGGR